MLEQAHETTSVNDEHWDEGAAPLLNVPQEGTFGYVPPRKKQLRAVAIVSLKLVLIQAAFIFLEDFFSCSYCFMEVFIQFRRIVLQSDLIHFIQDWSIISSGSTLPSLLFL